MKTIGNLIKYEAPDSPQWKFAELDTCVRTFNGPYDELFSSVPRRGEGMEDLGENMLVQDSTLKRQKLGLGVLTVNLVGSNPTSGIAGSSEEPLKIKVEIDWAAVQKDLRTHPRYQEAGDDPISDEGWARIEKWKQETDPTRRANYQFQTENGVDSLLEVEQNFAEKVVRGVEGYNVYAPIVKKTGTYKNQPATTGAGYIDDPSVTVSIPDGYAWLKTACRSVQNQDGSWDLLEEWTGAEEIDEDLYPADPPASAATVASAAPEETVPRKPSKRERRRA